MLACLLTVLESFPTEPKHIWPRRASDTGAQSVNWNSMGWSRWGTVCVPLTRLTNRSVSPVFCGTTRLAREATLVPRRSGASLANRRILP